MTSLLNISLLYLLAVSTVSVFYMASDKHRARLQIRRTPESLLWFLAVIGGTPGILLGMKLFRHKTKKISFQLILALILLVQLALIIFVSRSILG